MLVLLYYLSQNPNFPESVKPLMGKLKNSEQMLSFLNELSQFTKTFSSFSSGSQNKQSGCEKSQTGKPSPTPPCNGDESNQKEKPQSPTQGIADDFIQKMLDNYLKNTAK